MTLRNRLNEGTQVLYTESHMTLHYLWGFFSYREKLKMI